MVILRPVYNSYSLIINKLKILITSVVLLLCLNLNSQNNNGEALAYNVGLGSFFGGIGAVINKDKNQKWHRAFLKGFWQGALGGYVVYEGKKRIYDFSRTKDYKYAWASKIIYSAGNSMIENAASNKDLWAKWNITIGFNRIEFETQEKFKVNYQLMPLSLISTIHTATKGKFNFEESVKTGVFIFTTMDENNLSLSLTGETFRNNILLLDTGEKFYNILPHEIIHTYQHQDFQNINTFFIKNKKEYINNELLKKLDKFIYLDLHSLMLEGLYNLEKSDKCYYDNFFEQEANFYSLRLNCN